jgi:hypothetical protein
MRTFLLTATIFIFVIILIIFFQNLANSVTGLWITLFQFDQNASASVAVFVLCGIGFLAGASTTMLITTLISEGKDEEAPGGTNW